MTAVMSSNELIVVPGEQATFTVQVRNSGTVVDEYTIEVLGTAGMWATIEPPVLTLFPGTEGTATVVFAPPRLPAVLAGRVPFGLRVAPREDPSGTTVEEGVLEIAPYMEASAELVPHSAHGRRSARYQFAFDNRGNCRINVPLGTLDPDNVLNFRLSPPTLLSEPGTATFAKVTVGPKKTFWRGPTQTKPFQVVGQPEGLPPVMADGVLLQDELLPGWLPKALLAALALLILAVVLWFVLLKPQVKSIAKKAAKDQVASAQTQDAIKATATKAAQQAVTGTTAPGTGTGKSPQPGQPGSGTGSPTGNGTATGNGSATGNGTSAVNGANGLRGTPIDTRLTTTGSGTASYMVPAGKVLQMTDIVLENTSSDARGTLSVQRSGAVLLNVGLENFRDLDYHFVAPIIFAPGEKLQIVSNVTACTGVCQPAIYFSGFLADAAG